jgi:hypothetical protein
VVQLDDLGGREEARCLFGEPLPHNRSDREVRRDDHAGVALARLHPLADLVQIIGPDTRGPDNTVDVVLDHVLDALHHDVRLGEVNGHLHLCVEEHVDAARDAEIGVETYYRAERAALEGGIDRGHQLEVRLVVDGAADEASHLAGGAENAYSDHFEANSSNA